MLTQCKIKASGIKNGKKLNFTLSKRKNGDVYMTECDKQTIIFANLHLKAALNIAPVIANCYTPDKNTLLYYFLVLDDNFFDKDKKIEIIGNLETIPYEKGKVY